MTDSALLAAPPTLADLEDARARLAGVATVTPLLEVPALNERLGGRVLLKAETLQRTGSFKFRGAWNALKAQEGRVRATGVVAFSSGNHAQAVALAARLLGARATIVMPADAPPPKLAATRADGADIVTYDRWREDRVAIGAAIAARSGALLVPPFEDPLVIAGQGTAGLEIAEQAASVGARPDACLVCVSGGGLLAGIATALTAHVPGIHLAAVEPVGFDDTGRSLRAGERVVNAAGPQSICDALLVPTPGELTFSINRRLVAGGVAVTDEEVLDAMAFALQRLKLVIEPGGAVALAALLAGRVPVAGRTVVALLSGGNVDPALLAQVATRTVPA